jgi:hypothetical protein
LQAIRFAKAVRCKGHSFCFSTVYGNGAEIKLADISRTPANFCGGYLYTEIAFSFIGEWQMLPRQTNKTRIIAPPPFPYAMISIRILTSS